VKHHYITRQEEIVKLIEMTIVSDEIIQLCKKKDRVAQHKLYMLSVKTLHNSASRYVVDSGSAQDIVHSAFIKIFQNINGFNGNSQSIFPWMRRIVINEALQHLRKNSKVDYVEEIAEETSLDGERQILDSMTSSEIWAIIRKLKETDQIMINLSIVDQLNHKEISELLGITESHSRTRLTRAKKALKSLINDRYKAVI